MTQHIAQTNTTASSDTSKENVDLLPFLSSRQKNWNGILLEQQHLPSGEHIVPPIAEHTLLLSIGHPLHIVQQRDDKRDERLLVPGDIIVAPAQQLSICVWNTPLTVLQIRLQQPYLEQVAHQVELSSSTQIELLNQFGMQDTQIEQIVLQLREELLSHELGGHLYVESLTNMLVVHLLRHYAGKSIIRLLKEQTLSKKALQQAIEYIQDHLPGDLSLDELAQAAQLSPFHFSRSFKQATGLAPHQYVIRQRLEHAKQLLLTTSLSIAEVAATSGFYDQGHLARHMRRYFGISPKDIKESKNIR